MSKFIAAPFGNYIKTEKTISVTGSWTIEKRTGRLIQIAKTLRLTKRGWVNKIGLRNPGVVNGLKKYKENEVFSIAGIEKDDWKDFTKIIPDTVNLEINLSCPNIDKHYTDGIEDFSSNSSEWFIGKISPTTTFKELENYITKFGSLILYTRPTQAGMSVKAAGGPYTVGDQISVAWSETETYSGTVKSKTDKNGWVTILWDDGSRSKINTRKMEMWVTKYVD